MIPELGHYALMLALGLALIQGTMPIVGTKTSGALSLSYRRLRVGAPQPAKARTALRAAE